MFAQTMMLLIALAAPSIFDEPPVSEIRDVAKLFDQKTVEEAQASLRQSERLSGVPTLVETVNSLGGETIEDEAHRRSRASAHQGIYILISKRDHKFDVLLSERYHFPSLPAAVREALLTEFKKGDFDAGLHKATLAISAQLDRARPTSKPSTEAARRSFGLPGPKMDVVSTPVDPKLLVMKNQSRLTLAGARAILAAAEAKSISMDWNMNIAVVDDGGHLLCFARLDGGRPASAATSITKAISAATFRQATGPLPKGADSPDILLSLSVQNAAAASGGKVTTLLGGLPIIVEGQVIGAIGVGGGTGDQDAEVARAGVDAFQKNLKAADSHIESKE